MKAIFVSLAAATALLAAPATAQDSETAGGKFIVGGIVGVDSVNAELDGFSSGDEDVLFGVTAGYDYETAKGLIVGIEAEYTDSSLGISATNVDIPGDRVSLNAGRDLYVGGRLGFRTGRNGLLYAKAGYTNASIEAAYNDGTVEVSSETSFDGVRLGVGGEIDLSSNYAIRLEYRYSDYGSFSVLGIDTGVNVSRNQGIITLLGKF